MNEIKESSVGNVTAYPLTTSDTEPFHFVKKGCRINGHHSDTLTDQASGQVGHGGQIVKGHAPGQGHGCHGDHGIPCPADINDVARLRGNDASLVTTMIVPVDTFL